MRLNRTYQIEWQKLLIYGRHSYLEKLLKLLQKNNTMIFDPCSWPQIAKITKKIDPSYQI